MDKWAVATKRHAGWALYENAAEVIAGEGGRRSESRRMAPFLLKSTTCAMNLKLFENRQKKGPRGVARALH